MTQEESLITDQMRAMIGVEGEPRTYEVEKVGIRMFARSVGHTDLVFYDEAYARGKGHRSLIAPPGYLGTAVFSPNADTGAPSNQLPTGRRMLSLNGGTEYEYTGVEIAAGDTLTAVQKIVSMDQRSGSMGPMVITRRETTYKNQNGEVVARAYGTNLQMPAKEG